MSYMHNALKRYAMLRGVKSKRYRKPKKLREETRELIKAMRLHKKRPTMKSKMHLMEEVADVQWCLTAIADGADLLLRTLSILRYSETADVTSNQARYSYPDNKRSYTCPQCTRQ